MNLILSIFILIICVIIADSEKLRPFGLPLGMFIAMGLLMKIWF